MEELQLSDTLRRYFSDVFLCCDEEKSGKASIIKTVDLIKSGSVPEDVITQIADTCWSPTTNYLNRKQFFSALKLVAAYQAGIPIRSDLLTATVDLPLPRFTWIKHEASSPIADLIELRSEGDYSRDQLDATSTDSEVDSDTLSIVNNTSPGASSVASDSPTPTNSVQGRSWGGRDWQGLVSEEQRQLLGTEEESSDKHSSEEDTEVSNEVWSITQEQREYYTNQFKSLQPDTNALLAGPVARMFFEKSRLPVHELRKIWQLADVTKDGALSLQEFNTAMHLVVLRRNHIELPDVLPPSLIPGNETPLSVSPETEPILSPQTKDTAKEWTKFIESPTSSISSPGPKPVNFDFQKVTLDKDSKILHPVALRLTPEYPPNEDIIEGPSPKKNLEIPNVQSSVISSSHNHSAIQRPQPKKITLPGPGAIPPPPNHQPPVSTDEAGPVSLPAFPPPKKEKPPPPPPRPFRSHGRSSSLDLNRLCKGPPSVPPRVSPQARRLVNQRSEGDCQTGGGGGFADFDKMEKYENVGEETVFPGEMYEAERKKLFARFASPEVNEDPPRKHGAFEVYRKPASSKCKEQSPVNMEDKARWELFKKLQDENSALLRICQELSEELAETRQEKHTLKVMLEKQINGG